MKNVQTQFLFNTDKTYKIKPKSVRALKEALLVGPVAISVSAHNTEWDYYAGGIMDNKDCGTRTTHAVIAVGYGKEKLKPYQKKKQPRDYLIIKNSWGKNWGENGYAKIALSTDKVRQGICGSLTFNYIATVKKADGTTKKNVE